MIRLPCPNCKAIHESATDPKDTIYCRDCGFIIREAPVAGPDPASQWLYAKNRQKVGPISLQALRGLFGSGQLVPGDMVLQMGTQKWGPASAVPGLLPVAAPPPAADPGFDDEWYCVQDRKKIGPLSRQAMQKLIGAGTIRPADMVLKEGTQKWSAANTVAEFAGLFGSSPAPVPPKPPVVTAPPKSPVVAAPPANPDGWFYVKDGKKVGPVSTAEIRQLAASGTLATNALVLRAGTPKWVPLDSVPELAPPPAPKPAPLPVPPPLPPIAVSPPPLPPAPPPLPPAPPPLPVEAPPAWPELASSPEPIPEVSSAEWPEPVSEAEPAAEWATAVSDVEPAVAAQAAPPVVVVGTGELGALLRKILGRTA
ncbi:MAG: DUF4339 domain-containing protein [Planctomycetia bacterium]|nr:DUF4339 domain-containing protein [Planctomycetia bacterium]